jgi:hypothetical protein
LQQISRFAIDSGLGFGRGCHGLFPFRPRSVSLGTLGVCGSAGGFFLFSFHEHFGRSIKRTDRLIGGHNDMFMWLFGGGLAG